MAGEQDILLSTAYLGPVQYFCKMVPPASVWIEKHENYTKQTYRNRCIIAGPNGPLTLTVPVRRGSFHKTPVRDLEIEYGKPWQSLHWRSITAAYSNAPFFEYYRDILEPFYRRKIRFLIDLNIEMTRKLMEEMGFTCPLRFTRQYQFPGKTGDMKDYRDRIRPKHPPADPEFNPPAYIQVFNDRYKFLPNLSIVDVIFNLGPESRHYLESCVARNPFRNGNPR
ncbi:MAG TPA: hypothetical protein ENN63_05420 [Bacteroidetes bacterium]|nr:hypothetical protein [Bacteroidota bacterium]